MIRKFISCYRFFTYECIIKLWDFWNSDTSLLCFPPSNRMIILYWIWGLDILIQPMISYSIGITLHCFLDWRVFVVFFDCKCDFIMEARKWSNCFSIFSAFYVLGRKIDTWCCSTWNSNFSKQFGLVSTNFSIFLPHVFLKLWN